ncbi:MULTISPECIES: response regulator transcription factor [Paenibacillus]|uniref:response regulator n=1 Tax=Paenibacillus TaxID=44249 RepID=UPI000CF91906|nr:MULTISPECIES: response regulator transcription factor [Paenibacillus]MBJ9987334.1 response regulator transcription factor [Paenibacillus sp. S28]PQP89102.1 DNA-binding response regulator [Paenibacillus sp. AR247]
MSLSDNIKVLLADDQTMIRQGFGYLIGLQSDMTLVGEASDGGEAVEMATRLGPDVILMDVQMPVMSGIEATREIMRRLPEMKIVILTTFDDQEYIYQGIRAGAVGYLLKDAEVEDMLGAVRSAHRGEAVYKTALAASALLRVASPEQHSQPEEAGKNLAEPLTEREREILQEMAYGLRNDEIARKLVISEGTVKSHVHRILQKFGCQDRTQVVVIALRSGMVK